MSSIDDDRRPVRGEPGEERPPSLVGLEPHLARRERREPESRVLEPEREREDGGRTCGIGNGSEDVLFESGDLGERSLGRIRVEHTRVRLEHLAERPVGDRLAVRQAAALQHRDALGLRVRPREQLARQATLPDAGVAIDRDELRRGRTTRAVRRSSEGARAPGRGRPSARAGRGCRAPAAAEHARRASSSSSTVATGRDFPLHRSSAPTSRKRNPARRAGRPLGDEDLAGSAVCSSRAAAFTASPVTIPTSGPRRGDGNDVARCSRPSHREPNAVDRRARR